MGCSHEPSTSQGSPTHTMVCVLPLLDTDIIYCISLVNTERMWCYLFVPLVCSSSPELSVSRFGHSPSARGNVPLPHMGKSISTSQLGKRRTKPALQELLTHLSSQMVVSGESMGAPTRGAAGKRSWAAHSDSHRDANPLGQRVGTSPGEDRSRANQTQGWREPGKATIRALLCSATWCWVRGWAR